jgi:hypothetical protein
MAANSPGIIEKFMSRTTGEELYANHVSSNLMGIFSGLGKDSTSTWIGFDWESSFIE